jgi:hypothetical protein
LTLAVESGADLLVIRVSYRSESGLEHPRSEYESLATDEESMSQVH